MNEQTKFTIQDSLYEFPYHYLPSLEEGAVFRLHRSLAWGLDYMTYMSFVVELLRQSAPYSICDIGCGDGRLLHMVKSFIPRVTGIDLSERAIAFARAFNPEVEVLCGDIADLSQQYDAIALVEVLEHIPDQQITAFVNHVASLVARNGFLIVTVPTVNVPLNKKHYRHYDVQVLRDTLAPHFQIKDCWWLYRRGIAERLIRRILCNRLFLLNSSKALTLVWKIHRRFTYYANSKTGAHLACVALRA
jgi:SAM-dependent methyltransferase